MEKQRPYYDARYRPELWGGIECTINRVNNNFRDQLEETGHYGRTDDISAFAKLGITKMRYPILWEKHLPQEHGTPDWTWIAQQLKELERHNIEPIVGLVHHGSGPAYTNLEDKRFPEKLAAYAKLVAQQFPTLQYYTPVNEPLTTARFSGLYGFWYPHKRNDRSFLKMLLNELKGTVLAMREIRKVNPNAKLVQTEDLTKVQSTRKLQYQANFENSRRWLTYDLLCGKVNITHPMWKYFIAEGIKREELLFFMDHPCPPDVIGCNYYLTSERYLDEHTEHYPQRCHGSNGRHRYADIESVRVNKLLGMEKLITEVWDRYQLPVAITEIHLHCTREEQMRWLMEGWDTCCKLKAAGVDVRGMTIWAMLGSCDWNSLITAKNNHYESGVYDVRNNNLRETALGKIATSLTQTGSYEHPVLAQKGWWHGTNDHEQTNNIISSAVTAAPILVIGKNGTLGRAFARLCKLRSLHHVLLSRQDLDICNEQSILQAIEQYRPWAIINTAGFVDVDRAESCTDECMRVNAYGAGLLARVCNTAGIRFMTFSTDMVFDGGKKTPYTEIDLVNPVNVYGFSKVQGELKVMAECADSLVIRTSSFFGPWDQYNFAYNVLQRLQQQEQVSALEDVYMSPTYVPDLVNASLDIFLDEANGIWHITNDGTLSWADLAREIANRGGFQRAAIQTISSAELMSKAKRPLYTGMSSGKGIQLPSLEHAIDRYFTEKVF